MCCCGTEAVDPDDLRLCCALCCVNCTAYPNCRCLGCSGKAGVCCCNIEMCCKIGAPCLCPCCCCGINLKNNDCAIVNGQFQCLFVVCSFAIPCNQDVPAACTILGCTVCPTCGYCVLQKEVMYR